MSRLSATLKSLNLHAVLPLSGRHVGWMGAACLAALALTACGGGTQAKRFVPTKIMSFGDDNSFISAVGYKYTVNDVVLDPAGTGAAVDATSTSSPQTFTTDQRNMTFVCGNKPIWVQTVAAYYGMDSSQCRISTLTTHDQAQFLAKDPGVAATGASASLTLVPSQVDQAAANAGVDAVIASINANVAQMNNQTLVLVMAGQPDVLQVLKNIQAGMVSQADGKALAKAAGKRLSDALLAVKAMGARTLLMSLPQLDYTPMAQAPSAVSAGTPAILATLVASFNDGLIAGSAGSMDGRVLAYARAELLTVSLATLPAPSSANAYGLINVTQPACVNVTATTLPVCDSSFVASNTTGVINTTNATAASNAATTYLWADATHFSPVGHAQLATLAINAIARNPF